MGIRALNTKRTAQSIRTFSIMDVNTVVCSGDTNVIIKSK